jgi:hypothetical protein
VWIFQEEAATGNAQSAHQKESGKNVCSYVHTEAMGLIIVCCMLEN